MPIDKDIKERIGKVWDKELLTPKPKKIRWWESPLVLEHVNYLHSGRYGNKIFGAGLLESLKKMIAGRVFERGISVGCGVGFKEMRLIQEGVVRSFELFEFSEERIKKGQEIAQSLNIADSVNFRHDDAFEVIKESSVDFVHWNNSLHHMLDVKSAVEWSHKILKDDGLFYMYDFVGPNRFQWSDESLALMKKIWAILPGRFLKSPFNPDDTLSGMFKRPNPKAIAVSDPSEAAQSDLILECVRRYFPEAEITFSGGTVYNLALNDIIYNFDEENENDAALLKMLLLIDELCLQNSQYDNHYASALAWKK